MLRKFKITVQGQQFEVLVEEVTEEVNENAGPARSVKLDGSAAGPENASEQVPPAIKQPRQEAKAAGDPTAIPAPLSGTILEVAVNRGDRIEEGAVIVILEAMKMENEISAPVSGTVVEVLVRKGDTVNSGDPLVYIA